MVFPFRNGASRRGPFPVVSVACVEAGKVFGFGRKLDGGIWIVRLAAAANGVKEAATARKNAGMISMFVVWV